MVSYQNLPLIYTNPRTKQDKIKEYHIIFLEIRIRIRYFTKRIRRSGSRSKSNGSTLLSTNQRNSVDIVVEFLPSQPALKTFTAFPQTFFYLSPHPKVDPTSPMYLYKQARNPETVQKRIANSDGLID